MGFTKGHLFMVATVFTLACGSESNATNWEAQRQVAGDTTTVHTLAGQVWPSEVRLEEDLAIGVLDGPVHLIFGEITRMAEDLQGGIYVLDAQVPEIRHFDGRGEFVGSVGRSGEGPGEYTHLTLGMVVDSTGVLELVLFIEENYQVKVEDTELLPENLDSVSNVAAFISRKQDS